MIPRHGPLHRWWGAAVAAALFLSPARAETFFGRVVGVSDGDSLTVLSSGQGRKVRLHGVDTPEKKQDFGARAKQFTSRVAFDKEVSVEVKAVDRYGRTVGVVALPDGQILNRMLVQEGFAWWYQSYAPKDHDLRALEEQARKQKRGLWAQGQPIPPWEFRRRQRQTAEQRRLGRDRPAGAARRR